MEKARSITLQAYIFTMGLLGGLQCYRKIRDLGAKAEHLLSMSGVVEQVQGQIKGSHPGIAGPCGAMYGYIAE